jgi:hypothetical protein
MKLLIEAGTRINQREIGSGFGWTNLMISAAYSHPRRSSITTLVCNLLLKSGSDPFLKTLGSEPLTAAEIARKQDCIFIADLLESTVVVISSKTS